MGSLRSAVFFGHASQLPGTICVNLRSSAVRLLFRVHSRFAFVFACIRGLDRRDESHFLELIKLPEQHFFCVHPF